MWLIDTSSHQLVEFVSNEDLQYAISSHTWMSFGEVTFNDMKDPDPDRVKAKQKPGWAKIERTCQIALSHRLEYVWIDTCCIDKSSSAELSDAINSMFRWYKDSVVCIAYLQDLPSYQDARSESVIPRRQLWNELKQCRWFRRGWTLQELVASKVIHFHDCDWRERGTKDSLQQAIHEITHIPVTVLNDNYRLSAVPVGQKMSWAAERTTSRIEDAAYSLFGIFDVNMPLIYGEGQKAFIRLQEAIAQQSNDPSLFAWSIDAHEITGPPREYCGVFASSLRYFKRCQYIALDDRTEANHFKFSITDRGVKFSQYLIKQPDGGYLMPLHCQDKNTSLDIESTLSIRLERSADEFVRCQPHQLYQATFGDYKDQRIYIPKVLSHADFERFESRHHNSFRFICKNSRPYTYSLFSYHPGWDESRNSFLTNSHSSFMGDLDLCFDKLSITSGPLQGGEGPVPIFCGFTTESSQQTAQGSLKPWAILHCTNCGLEQHELHQDRPELLNVMKNWRTWNGPPKIRKLMSDYILRGNDPSNLATLKPYYHKRVPGQSLLDMEACLIITITLSLSISSKVVQGNNIHELVLEIK